MSSDSSIFRYPQSERENPRSKEAKQEDVATSSRRHRQFSDIRHESKSKEIPHPSHSSAPQAEVNPSESQVKDEEGTNKSIFTKIFECFLCGSKSNLPEEVKQNLGRRFNIEDDISLSERRIEPPSSERTRSISSNVGQDDINNESGSQDARLHTSFNWGKWISNMEEEHIPSQVLRQSKESYELPEVASGKSDIKEESDEEKDARLLKELKERIKPLTKDEIKVTAQGS